MGMKKRRDHLQEIYTREAMCEGVFFEWVSGQAGERVLNALGELLWWLDGIASCRWGCRGGDHEEEYLLGRISANAAAALLLVRRGYMDPASGVFRQLAEARNLLDLFTHSSWDHQEWLSSDERGRKDRYSAFNVRLKLERLGVDPTLKEDGYQVLSKYGTHPGPGAEPRPHDSPEEPTVGTAYRPAVGLSFTVAVATAVIGALLFGIDLMTQANVKRDVLNAAIAANEELQGIDLDALKEESTLVFEPPRIEVTVETHENGVDGASDGALTSDCVISSSKAGIGDISNV